MNSFNGYKTIVTNAVTEWANKQPADALGDSIRYALDGGKRLRPVMLLAACEIAGGNVAEAMPFAVALELIHNYSLVHDDMPCMDNDDLRRGNLTVHKKYGQWLALLCGDALLNGAYEILLAASTDNARAKAATTIAHAAGHAGMIKGQLLDLSNEGAASVEKLIEINRYKTGALFIGALKAGAELCGADKKTIGELVAFGENFGLAFQIADDLDDLLALNKTAEELKYNYAALVGESAARDEINEYVLKAKIAVNSLNNPDILLELLDFFK